ncbi:MAG: FAD/NAD(P)-binding protein, partial [Hyphomonadaceae bacterium]
EARAMAARGEPWQYAVDRLRARTPELWRRLAPDAQHRFLRHLRVWWDVHRHRAPPEIALRVKALMEEGRLRVLAGEVVSAAPGPRGVRLQHRGRGSLARHNMDVAAIVNCTGASPDVGQRDDPLTHQLLRDGVARPHVNGLGFDIDADSRIVDANGAPQQGLFAIGPITMGACWESTAVPEIRVRAAAIAAMLSPESET